MRSLARATATLMSLMLTTFIAISANITGLVKDRDTNEPLMEASVKLLAAKDSSFVSGVTTDLDGKFKLENIKKGSYLLEITYIGYSDHEQKVTVGNSNLRLGAITMKESSHLLGEVSVVATKTPIKVMEDTVEYNADSYHTQPNAVVEDLLKRLPGVEVDSDGKITANGKSISKILIDGKEFFSDDPQVASKNLPASMIDKLQVVDRKSDEARLTGVDDGEDETVINLTVKRGMNQGWFGTAEAGYGTDDRYAASFNVNRFWNGNQLTLLGNLNNTNQLGFTDSNGNRFRRFGGNRGITTSRAFGINFNVGNEEIFRIGGDVMYSNTDRYTRNRQDKQWLFTDSTSFENIRRIARDRGNNIRGDFRMVWKPDSFNTLEFRPNFSYNHNKSYSDETRANISGELKPVSDARNSDSSRGNSYEFAGRLIYSHRFRNRPGRSFSAMVNYQFSNVREKANSLSDIIYHLMDTEEILDQYDDNRTWSNSVRSRVTWTEPIGKPDNGHSLEFSYRMNYRWNNADKFTYNIPEGYDLDILPPPGIDPDPEYSNSFRNNFFNQDISLGYRKNSKQLNFNAGISLVPSMSKSTDLINSDRNIATRWVWNFAPYMRMRYKFSKHRSLQANYRGRSSQPSMSQLQPVDDISDPLNIKRGNPDLDPSFSHSLNVRFQDFNPEAQRSIMLMADFSFTQNAIISKTIFDKETSGRLTTYVNVNGVWSGRLMNMMSMPLRNKKWMISNHIFGNANHNIGFNNGERNASMSINIFESPGISFRPDNFEFELRPQYGIQLTHNSLQSSNNMTVHRYGGRFDATYYTPWGLTIQSDINYSATSGYSAGYDTKTLMWNASVSQQFLRDKSLTLSVRAYDLLNQRKSVNRTVTANYIEDIDYNTLSRYFMFTVSYRFNTFGKGNQPSGHGGDRMRQGGFGGPGRPPRR